MLNEQKTTDIADNVKRVWVTPVVRTVRAGEAEAFGGGGPDGGPGGVNQS